MSLFFIDHQNTVCPWTVRRLAEADGTDKARCREERQPPGGTPAARFSWFQHQDECGGKTTHATRSMKSKAFFRIHRLFGKFPFTTTFEIIAWVAWAKLTNHGLCFFASSA